MGIFKAQVKDYIIRNKAYIIIFWIYCMIMANIMARLQSEVPFADLHNYFENNYIIILIMLFQGTIIMLALVKNGYPKDRMLKQDIKSFFISNVIISAIFSLLTIILVSSVFYLNIASSNNLSSYESVYFFGLEITKMDAFTTIKVVSYFLPILLAIIALSNLLCLIPKLWTKISLSLITVFFIFSLWKKTSAVNTVTSILQMNNSPYFITLGVSLIAILIFVTEWVMVNKIYIIHISNKES